jgi:antitoxin VapB
MAFSIKNDDTDRLARELAATTGETLTEAVTVALEERLARERAHLLRRPGVGERLRRLATDVAVLPLLDTRSADNIVGYDDRGLPA